MPRHIFLLLMALTACHAPRWHEQIPAHHRPELSPERWKEQGHGRPAGELSQRSSPSLTREVAFDLLLRTRVFARRFTGGPAIRGPNRPSPQSEAFLLLSKQPDARAIFIDLLARAQLAGQLYGLCGLHEVDRPELLRRVAPYLDDTRVVYYANGCVHSLTHVREIVRNEYGEDILTGHLPDDLTRSFF